MIISVDGEDCLRSSSITILEMERVQMKLQTSSL